MENREILKSLVSHAEKDSEGLASANVVDGLFAIARGLEKVASALRDIDSSITHAKVGEALEGLASLKFRE